MKKINPKGTLSFKSDFEINAELLLLKHFKNNSIPDDEILENIGLFFTSKNLSRVLCLNELYKMQIDINGNILDFGTRWGQNASLFAVLRGIYEPFNRHKRIFAFDTFTGFNKIHSNDGISKLMKKGHLSTSKNYENFLQNHLNLHEKLNPLSHIQKSFVLKGDGPTRLKKLLKDNPEIIISMAYFDFDLYEPTLKCINLIKNRLVKGSILAFDEANDHDSPGETKAIMKTFGLNKVKLNRFRYGSRISYFVYE